MNKLFHLLEIFKIKKILAAWPTDIKDKMDTGIGSTITLPGDTNATIGWIKTAIISTGIITKIMSIAGTIAMLVIIWSGFQMLFADESKKEGAKKAIQYTLSGLLIIIFAYSIIRIILDLLF